MDRRKRGGDEEIVTKVSPWSLPDTVARLAAVLAARDVKVFAAIDYVEEARAVGLLLPDTRMFLVGSAMVTTQAIAASPSAALDVPVRVVVWEDGHETKVSYLSTAAVVGRHGLDRQLARALGNIEAITGAVIDR